MRTRTISLIEKYSIIMGILLVISLSFLGVYSIYNYYAKKIKELKNKIIEYKQEKERYNAELSRLKKEIEDIKRKIKAKISRLDIEKKEYEDKKRELENAIKNIPPIYMKSLLRERLLKIANYFNIDVLKYSAVKIEREKYRNAPFFPLKLMLNIVGEYKDIKRFFWYVDHIVRLKDIYDDKKEWNFLFKVYSLSFIVNTINKNINVNNVPKGPIKKGVNLNKQPVSVNSDISIYKNYKGMLRDGKLYLNLEIVTFFRKE